MESATNLNVAKRSGLVAKRVLGSRDGRLAKSTTVLLRSHDEGLSEASRSGGEEGGALIKALFHVMRYSGRVGEPAQGGLEEGLRYGTLTVAASRWSRRYRVR